MLILAGDIGATNSRLSLASYDVDNGLQPIKTGTYASYDYPNLTSLLQRFLATTEQNPNNIDSACIAIAGPVKNNCVTVTNLGWQIDGAKISAQLGISNLDLINDFTAIGYGATELNNDNLHLLQDISPEQYAPKLVLGAGSGLGACYLTAHNNSYQSNPSEGGHTSFAPRNKLQLELLRFLQTKYGHVSTERVVSGKGIANIYHFLQAQNNIALNTNINAAAITSLALKNRDALANQAIEIFIQSYAQCAADLACTLLPFGGIYLAGGIAPKLKTFFTTKNFLTPFLDQGRMQNLLLKIPVAIVLDEFTGLKGAIQYAIKKALQK